MSVSGILRLEEEQLRDDEVRRPSLDLRAEEDDPLAQQPREDVERALEAAVRLDDHRYQVVRYATHRLHIIRNRRCARDQRGAMEIEREIVVPEPPDEVWEALTEPERLEEWFAHGGRARRASRRRGHLPLGRRRRAARGRPRARGSRTARPRLGRRRQRRDRARARRGGHPRARRRVVARLRPGARAARAGVDGARSGVDRVFAALGDAGRRSLVEAVATRGTATATELAAELPVTRQAVAKQLSALDRGGPAAARPGAAARRATR